MRPFLLLACFACAQEVLPLDPTDMGPVERCSEQLVREELNLEPQTVTDPPLLASVGGEVAVVLRGETLQVVRWSSRVGDVDPIATHTAERALVHDFAARDDDYHLVSERYTSPDVWITVQRVLESGAPAEWRAGDSVQILDAVVTGDPALVAVRTSPTSFRIHTAEDVIGTRGVAFEAPEILAVRIVPEARLVAIRSRAGERSELRLMAFDPATGSPRGELGPALSCELRPLVQPFDLAVAGATFLVIDCEDGTQLIRLRDGAIEASRTIGDQLARVGSRIAIDAAGRLGVATWSGEDTAPVLHVFDPADLSPMRDPIGLEAPNEWGIPTQMEMTADRDNAGRWAIAFSHVYGHGWGPVRLARVNACLE